MAATGEADLAFAKIAVLRRLVSQEQVQECFRALGNYAMQGKDSSLAEIMVEKKMIPATESDAILKMIELGQVVPELPGYTLLHELGRGGMGAVYKGLQTALDRPVAIKILFPELARNERYLTRFLNEAKAVARLQHPNIVSAIDVGEAGGFHYFAMEFVEGQTVAGLVKDRGRLEEKTAVEITLQTARALEHAWKHKLVHRDVKPENIILAKDGSAKLADLGIAKQVDADTSLTMDGGVVGSPNYISPEQANGVKDIDTRSDIYSLGGTLYFMLTGEAPYKGDTAAVVMAQHMVAKLPNPRDKVPTLSMGVCHVLEKMMAKDRTARPLDPTALIKDLEAVKAGADPVGAPMETGESTVDKTRQAAAKISAAAAAAAPAVAATKVGSQAGARRDSQAGRPQPLRKGEGQRGSSAEMKRIGTAEVRALSAKEAGRIDRRQKGLDPLAWVGIIGVGIVGIGLFFFMSGSDGKNNGKSASNNAPANAPANVVVPTNTGPTPTDPAIAVAEKEGQEAFEYVEKYEKEHPGEFEEILDKYGKVQDRFSGKTWGFKADDAVKRVKDAWRQALQTQLAALDAAVKPLVEQERYADAGKEFETRFPRDKVPALVRPDVETRWKAVLEGAQASFDKASGDAERAVQGGKFADAIAAYQKIVASYGLPEFVTAARDRLKAAEQAQEVDRARKAAEAERALLTRFYDRMAKVREAVQQWDFAKAKATVDAEKGLKDTPFAAELDVVRKDLDRLTRFKADLIAAVAAKKAKVDARSFLSDNRGEGALTAATEESFDLSPKSGGKMTLRWSTLKPEESYNLARLAVDRSDPAMQVALATFALELGLIEKAQAELKATHPDVVEMQKRVQKAIEGQELAEIDQAINKASAAIDGRKYEEAGQVLAALQQKSGAKLNANQKVIVDSLQRGAKGGIAEGLLTKARDLGKAHKVKEALESVNEIMNKYADTPAAQGAGALREELEEASVLRICTFEQGTQRPWRWNPAGADFALNEDPQFVKEGRFSGKITYPPHGAGDSMPCVRFPTLPKADWSAYTTFAMWVYSPGKTGDRLGIVLFVNGETDKYTYDYAVDWQGWKEIKVPLKSFQKFGSPSWDKIVEMALPIPAGKGGVYYVDEMRLTKDGS